METEDNNNSLQLESILNSQINDLINQNEQKIDIVNFCEHPHYLNQPLHGVEKFILKVFYGLELDNTEKYIKVRTFPTNEEGIMMTEVEFANFLIQQKRTNLLAAYDFGVTQHLLLVCGRRGGKTFIASIISAYEAYLLISKGDPQKHYGLPIGQKIKIITVATNSDQAKIASDAIKDRICNSPWFAQYVEGTTLTSIRLRTKTDIIDERESTISVDAMSCTASGVRGHTVIVAILDEFAHFTDKSGNRSGDSVYYSLVPSIATFGKDGKILALSNPYAKSGIFYTLYRKAMGSEFEKALQTIRVFQMPSWEMNDTLNFDFFSNEYTLNPESFDYEYGAEFSSTVTGFFKFPEKIEDCIDKELMEPLSGGRYTYYLSIDPASVGHGYALCMVHIEQRETETGTKKIVIVDRWKRWMASDEEFAASGLAMIDPSVIDEYIIKLARVFKISMVRYDQYESASSIHKLIKAGVPAERKPITSAHNMEMYKNLRNLIYNDEIVLPSYKQGIGELRNLQERKFGKNRFSVCAPIAGEITTDDLADVLAGASFMAIKSEVVGSNSMILGMSGGQAVVTSGTKSSGALQSYRQKLSMHKTTNKVMMRKRGW